MKNIIFGLHAVEALLQKHSARVSNLYVLQGRQDQRIDALLQLAKKSSVRIHSVSRQELDRMTDGENHQGVVAECHATKLLTESDLEKILDELSEPAFLLVLD